MKLLSISLVLLVLHIQFYRMEPNPNGTSKDLSSDRNSEAYKSSYNTTKPMKLPSSSRGSTAQIANAAAKEAKAASEAQDVAGQNASKQVKLLLAERAMAAAWAASLLVKGKEAIVERLAKKIQEVEAVVAQIKASLETSQANAEIASAALKMNEKHNATMQAVMNEMRSSLKDFDTLIEQAEADLKERNQMVAKAKELDDQLCQEMAEAKAEYEKFKLATCRGVSAALEAKQNSSSPPNVAASPDNSSSYDWSYIC